MAQPGQNFDLRCASDQLHRMSVDKQFTQTQRYRIAVLADHFAQFTEEFELLIADLKAGRT